MKPAEGWRCYSPSALSPDRSRYTGGPAFCSDNEQLEVVEAVCAGLGRATLSRCATAHFFQTRFTKEDRQVRHLYS